MTDTGVGRVIRSVVIEKLPAESDEGAMNRGRHAAT
jgi:hypothetical protein